MNFFLSFFVIIYVSLFQSTLKAGTNSVENKPYFTAELYGQLGNNLFQVATAYGLAWDNDAEPYFPTLGTLPSLYHHVFSRCKIFPPDNQVSTKWREPTFRYHPIPFQPGMNIDGYFQSEKYFSKYRDRILELFAPCARDLHYMQQKYKWLIDHPNTVGVQIRHYIDAAGYFPQYGKDYLEKALALFPESSLFVVSSNNLDFARENMPIWAKNVCYIEDEKYYIELYLLSFCKHNIISNSSYGWWSAWLNRNPDKIVVRPKIWFNGIDSEDVPLEDWIPIDAKQGEWDHPGSY